MVNENLKNAVRNAGLTPEELADILQVDPKTVQRWLAGTVPYPRHRAAITRALDLEEHDLWPELDPASTTASGARSRQTRTAAEVVGGWAFADDPEATDPVALLANDDGPIDLLDNSLSPSLTTALARALTQQATAGRPVRILVGSPKLALEPLIDHPNIEVRVSDAREGISLLRVGETMLLSFDLPLQGYDPPPLLMLRRAEGGGLFDRLRDTIETLWNDPDEILQDPAQLDGYLTNNDDDEEAGSLGFDAATDGDQSGQSADRARASSLQQAEPPEPAVDSEPPRRWPRRRPEDS